MTRNESARRIAALVMLLLAGILAGAQLAKIAPLVDWYQREAGYSLVTIGWLTSTLGIFVALAALPAAFAIDRAGMYVSFVASSVALALGGVILASFEAPAAVLSGRLVEALGYLAIVIATPALLAALAPDRLKAPALAIWGGFVPLGYAFADFSAAALLPVVAPRTYLMIVALCFALCAAVAAALAAGLKPAGAVATDRPTASLGSTFTVPVGAVAASFGAYVVLSLGFFSFLPSFAGDGSGAILLSAGFVALLVPFGNVLAGILVEGRGARFIAWLTVAGFLASAASWRRRCSPASPRSSPSAARWPWASASSPSRAASAR